MGSGVSVGVGSNAADKAAEVAVASSGNGVFVAVGTGVFVGGKGVLVKVGTGVRVGRGVGIWETEVLVTQARVLPSSNQ